MRNVSLSPVGLVPAVQKLEEAVSRGSRTFRRQKASLICAEVSFRAAVTGVTGCVRQLLNRNWGKKTRTKNLNLKKISHSFGSAVGSE
jgi:hypothetical protein